MFLTTSIFQEFWLGTFNSLTEGLFRFDPCMSFQKNFHTEALCTLLIFKGVFSFIQKSEIKFTPTQSRARTGQWPSRNFLTHPSPAGGHFKSNRAGFHH